MYNKIKETILSLIDNKGLTIDNIMLLDYDLSKYIHFVVNYNNYEGYSGTYYIKENKVTIDNDIVKEI